MLRNDLTGKTFGKLKVIKCLGKIKNKIRYLCKCECGNEKSVAYAELVNGHTKSCGCLHKQIVGNINRKHSLSGNKCGNRLYALWKSIKYRCCSKTSKDYYKYGGRGITICDEWKNDFLAFYNWAIANGYRQEKLPNGLNKWTIERIDNNKGYSPDNCRFVTNKEQSMNKRTTLTYEERYPICPICGKRFKVNQRNKHIYCSIQCAGKGRKNARLQKTLCDKTK